MSTPAVPPGVAKEEHLVGSTPSPAEPQWPVERREALEEGLAACVAELRDDLHPRLLAQGPDRARAEKLHAAEEVGDPYDVWADVLARRIAVLWVLKSLYVRVLEDRSLIGARIASVESQALFEHLAPHLGETSYLAWAYKDLAQEPGGLPDLFARQAAEVALPGDEASKRLLAFWREVDPDTSQRRWSFAEGFDTRLIGDLYEELDPVVRDKFALCQTPWFVEEFMLDRTLKPALAELGVEKVRMIDPACGSGHFVVGSFRRIVRAWQAHDRKLSGMEIARRALAQVVGIDINDYACALSRFRLLLAAFEVAGIKTLAEGSTFSPLVFCADALVQHEQLELRQDDLFADNAKARAALLGPVETSLRLKPILDGKFQVVVANPPYIAGKDARKRDYYREHYAACHGKFQLVAPFTERCFQLAETGGWVGLFNGNGFMKRSFGVPLVKEVLAEQDLTQVVDCSGVSFGKGYGTPTVLLFARRRTPSGPTTQAVLGRRGEPSSPADPVRGVVWSSITAHANDHDFENDFITVTTMPRESFNRHPWSLGGGGASELRDRLEERGQPLTQRATVAIGAVTLEDELYQQSERWFFRHRVPSTLARPFVVGDMLRDWQVQSPCMGIYPQGRSSDDASALARLLWPFRTNLKNRKWFKKTQHERGLPWIEYGFESGHDNQAPTTIAFGEVATQNHFVLGDTQSVFTQTAPTVRLPVGATEDEHLELLGLLNSSTIGFWLRQVAHDKGNRGEGGGICAEAWERFFQFDGTKLKQAPLVEPDSRVLSLTRSLDRLGREQAQATAEAVLTSTAWSDASSLRRALERLAGERQARLRLMAGLQEELDWLVYELYGLLPTDSTPHPAPDKIEPMNLGHRPFEIVLARRVANQELETAWFERNGSQPTAEVPAEYPKALRQRIESRLALIASNKDVALIEQPEYKRRWRQPSFEKEVREALESWILDKVEAWARQGAVRPSAFTVADAVRAIESDPRIVTVATVRAGRQDVDLLRLMTELVEGDSVPNNPRHRFTEQGLLKRTEWEKTWALQRREDAGEKVEIPVPPKYGPKDFKKPGWWSLRGALDVPKERFVAFPEGRSPTGEAVYGWAGWDSRQRAQALSALDEEAEDRGDPLEVRCGVLQGLWALLPDLGRDHQKSVAEYRALASSACGQDRCPCPVLETWTTRFAPAKAPKGGKKKAGKPLPASDAAPAEEEPATEARIGATGDNPPAPDATRPAPKRRRAAPGGPAGAAPPKSRSRKRKGSPPEQ